jgi:hypothetical protein
MFGSVDVRAHFFLRITAVAHAITAVVHAITAIARAEFTEKNNNSSRQLNTSNVSRWVVITESFVEVAIMSHRKQQ